ncbi:putative gustatory receptor 28b isoform X2 [Homalodisca vitripennis]|uniref:putative gustatory receptor 28b isoform X2 n=1 Tax=Homalodisca vitripennis TaxID=197043 RepID=UPI001EEA629B|nr:putative gustatory receptor 28b isoform X2 [Homalodisca vitripennis]
MLICTLIGILEEESKRTALLVHDLLDEDGHSSEVLQELETFSLALLHRKVNFSAAGFFDMNLKLVSRMASVMAPVILFLIQNDNRPRAGRRPRLS